MVRSLGITIGNQNSYVAAGQGGGIEILLNEYSSRSTPSMVAFTDHARSIGVDAQSNWFMNTDNTIYDLILLIGKPYKDILHADYPFKLEEAPDGQPMVTVRHLGEQKQFTITQVLAMLFTKLRAVASEATECVISCPQFFNQHQQTAVMQAALVAGLKPLQIINDMSAVILNYAYYRTTRADTHKFITFVNFGQSSLQCTTTWLSPRDDMVRILAAESEAIGGRDFDRILANHFVAKHNLKLSPKAYLKLVSSCEKVKRLLSANANEIPIHVESLISEDKDFTDRIDRETFEEMSKDLLQTVEACFKRTLERATANFELIINEISGARSAYLAAARTAAEAAAAAPAEVKPEQPEQPMEGVEESKDAEKKDQVEPAVTGDENSSQEPKDNEQSPKQAEQPKPTDKQKALKDFKAAEKAAEEAAKELEALEAARTNQIVELVGGSSRIPVVKQLINSIYKVIPSTTLNTDEAVARGCVLHCATLHPGMKVKREVKIIGMKPFSSGSVSCDTEMRRVELELITSDAKYRSKTEARNNLEEYIYSQRSRLEKEDPLLEELNSVLDWLFTDEGEDATEEEYVKRMEALKKDTK